MRIFLGVRAKKRTLSRPQTADEPRLFLEDGVLFYEEAYFEG